MDKQVKQAEQPATCIHNISLETWCGTCTHETGREEERLLSQESFDKSIREDFDKLWIELHGRLPAICDTAAHWNYMATFWWYERGRKAIEAAE